MVLGACLLEPDALYQVIEILKPECFYVSAHKVIFQVVIELYTENLPCDILTVVERLRQEGTLESVGGPFYVTKLTNMVVSSANVGAHARIILQKYMQREIIRIGAEMVNQAFTDTNDVFDILNNTEEQLFNISSGHIKKDFKKISSEGIKTIAEIKKRVELDQDITGVPSGFTSVDIVTCGWQNTDLIIVAARPSVGKTAFALNLARNAAMHPQIPKGAAVFSLEMSTGQIIQRLISAEADLNLEDISRGKLEEYQVKRLDGLSIQKLLSAPIFIDDTPALNMFELRMKARRLVHNHGVGVIIIDYLQLMSGSADGKNSNREQEISKISRDLKGLAKELHVPIIALSQLSRDIEKRANKEAQLSDLRESGAIEQDADMVMFLSRPDYQMEEGEADPLLRGKVEVKIAKHRNGKLATIPLNVDLSKQKFEDAVKVEDTRRETKYIGSRPINEGPKLLIDSDPELPF